LEVFLLSDGQITWGNRDSNSLVAHFEADCPYSTRFHCYTIGLGAENVELFQALTRRGGGIYPCYSEAYLPAVARAHRNHCLLIERISFKSGPAMSDVLVAGRQAAVYPGGDLVVSAKLVASGQWPVAREDKANSSLATSHRPLATTTGPTKLIVEGTFLGERVVYEYPIEITASSELAARGWGELAVSSLLALNDPKLDSLVTAYCQQFGIGSRVASFLVLENPADYKRLNLEEERGKVVPGGDLEQFLNDAWRNFARIISPKQAFKEFLNKIGSHVVVQNSNPSSGVPVAQFGFRSGPLQSPQTAVQQAGPGQVAMDEDHIRKLFGLLTDKDFELPEGVTGEALVDKKHVSPTYLTARQADPMNVHVYLDEAKRRANAKDATSAVRVLSSVVEALPTRADALRLVGYRLLDMQQPAQAVRLFQQVEESRPFEPHSYRDLARSLEESGRYGFAALQYEIVLAGAWHNRYRDSLKEVAREEYAHMMQEALARYRNAEIGMRNAEERRSNTDSRTATAALSGFRTPNSAFRISKELADYFGERLEGMASVRQQADLRVTISWNTDNTDVDLWVMEPDGTKCFYQNQKTSSGGQLSQDQTQGYGPERYQVQKALPGVYTVIVHYYRADANLLGGETHVNVLVTQHAGTREETVQRHTILLKQANEQTEVCKVQIK
jgi:tetratricopeptide (TPR) repeat protein